MKNISKYITYDEATTSQTAIRKGIDNTPTNTELINMQLVAVRVFDVVRDHFKTPLRVSSFYRCLKLNTTVGGAKNSQHKLGQAIDMQGTGDVTNKAIFKFIKIMIKDRFRYVALAEGVSFLLLLFIGMPIKYFLGYPEAVYYLGLIHGFLFILFLVFKIDGIYFGLQNVNIVFFPIPIFIRIEVIKFHVSHIHIH